MIIPIEEEKHLTKSSTLLKFNKTPNKLGIQGNLFNLIKAIYEKPQLTLYLIVKY